MNTEEHARYVEAAQQKAEPIREKWHAFMAEHKALLEKYNVELSWDQDGGTEHTMDGIEPFWRWESP